MAEYTIVAKAEHFVLFAWSFDLVLEGGLSTKSIDAKALGGC